MAQPSYFAPKVYPLSDGKSTVTANPGEAEQDARARGERSMVQDYMKHAALINRPVTGGDKVYSASNIYPNNWQGHLAAYADHGLFQGAGEALGSAERAGSLGIYAIPGYGQGLGVYDLAASGANAAKRAASGYFPSLQRVPDAPTALGTVQGALQVPQMRADAPEWQKIAELTPALMAGGGGLSGGLRNVLTRGAGSAAAATGAVYGGEGGRELASSYLGPQWGDVGELAGSALTAPLIHSAAQAPARWLSGQQAGDVAAAGERINVDPSYGALANIWGRRLGRAFGAISPYGSPAAMDDEAMRTNLKAAQDSAVTQLTGAPLPVSGYHDDNYVGQNLIDGSREAVTGIRRQLSNEQDAIANQMRGVDVDVRPIANAMQQSLQGNITTPRNVDMINNRINELLSMTPGGDNFSPIRGNAAAGTVPWSALKDWRTQLIYELENTAPGQARLPDHFISNLKDTTTNVMQQAADNASPQLGQDFRNSNLRYAQMQPILAELDPIAGKSVDTPNGPQWIPGSGMDPGQAAGKLKNINLKGSNLIENILSNSTVFPSAYWGRAAGGLLSQLGRGDQGTYRPEWTARDWNNIADPVKDALTLGPNGAPLAARGTLDDIATMGAHAVVPQSRHGLTETIGATGLAVGGIEAAQHLLEAGGVPALGAGAVATAIPYGIGKGLTSQAFKTSMATPTTFTGDLTNRIYQNVPAAAGSILNVGSGPWNWPVPEQPQGPPGPQVPIGNQQAPQPPPPPQAPQSSGLFFGQQ